MFGNTYFYFLNLKIKQYKLFSYLSFSIGCHTCKIIGKIQLLNLNIFVNLDAMCIQLNQIHMYIFTNSLYRDCLVRHTYVCQFCGHGTKIEQHILCNCKALLRLKFRPLWKLIRILGKDRAPASKSQYSLRILD